MTEEEQEPRAETTRWVLRRRAALRAQLKCPNCGTGRMPESRYCVHCGSPLPQICREESPEELERKRPSRRALNWVIDFVPGVLSLKVVVCSVAACLIGAAGFVLASRMAAGMQSRGGLAVIVAICLQAFLGVAAILIYVAGMIWLAAGEVYALWEAAADLRLKHWLLVLAATMLMAGLILSLA